MAARGVCLLLLALVTLSNVQLPAESTSTPSTEAPTSPSPPPTSPPPTPPTTTTPPITTPDPFPQSADLPNVTLLDEAVQVNHQVFMFRVTDDKGGIVIATVLNDPRFRTLPVEGDSNLWRVMRTDNGTLERNNFELTIQLKDSEGLLTNETLYIFVIGNDPPRFTTCPDGSRLGPNVPASTGSGVTIDTLTATDNDTLTYSLNCTPPAGPFVIDYATGQISTSRALRTETVETHTCALTANDGKLTHNSSTCVITIGITGINKPPVFREKVNSIDVVETVAAAGSVQYSFVPGRLTDPNDANLDNVTLSCIFSPSSAYGILELDTTAKAIKLKAGQQFDYETESQYTVTCLAVDDGGLEDNFTLTINVKDGNDPPVFQSAPPEVILYEGQAAAADTDLNPLVTDEDNNDTRKFSLLTGLDADKFSIDPSTGVLTHKGTLPAGSASVTYTVKVKVTDKGLLSDNATMTVVVLDANDNAPEFTTTSSQSTTDLHLQLPFNTVMGTVTATDKDAGTNADISYMAGSGSNCSGLGVKEDGTVDVVTSPLPMAYKSYCVMEVNCTDKGNPPLACKNTYKLYFKWDEPPKIAESLYEGEISEDAKIGDCVPGMTIDVTDAATDTFRCTQAGVPAPVFEVKHVQNAATATVCFKGPGQLDRNTPVHTFNVVCTDSNPASSSATITVRIKPNEAPKCPTDSATVNYFTFSVDVAALLSYKVAATDTENDILECPTTTWTPVGAPFSCNSLTCTCTATEDVKRTDTLEFTASITVRDKRNSVTCKLIFKITNPNKPPEVDSGYQSEVFVSEDSQDVAFAPSKLMEVKFKDDVLCSGGLSCTTSVDPSHFSNLFDIQFDQSTKTVKVFSAQRLDREQVDPGYGYRNTYDFSYQCSDGCKTMDPVVTTLHINNVNEKPVFRGGDTYFATFKETETSKIVPLNCDMFDPDLDDTHTLTIAPSPPADYIYLYDDPKTCSIRLNTEYDMDPGNLSPTRQYKITVKDKAGKTATATLSVTFELENDNYPQCKQQGYNKRVYYGTQPGSPIVPQTEIKVVPDTVNPSSTDLDRGLDGITTCRLKEATNGGGRYVDVHSDCEVVLTNSMDGKVESGDFFEFDIEICDHAPSGPKCGYCRLTVQYLAVTPPPSVSPVTPATTVKAATATTASTAVSTEAAASSSIWSNPGIIALIAALGLCGLGLLGLGGYLLYRACSSAPKAPTNLHGYQPAQKPGSVTKVREAKKPDKPKKPEKPKKEPKKPKEKKPEKPKPSTPPNQIHPATPSSIQIEEPAPPAYHMFEFNKERFDDFDYDTSPVRGGMPDV